MIVSALKNILLFLLALALSTLVWVVAQVEQNPEARDVISGVPVELVNVPAELEVSGVDQTMVSLLVSAPQDVWGRLDTRSFHAWVDLTGKDAGSHDLDVHVTPLERYTRIMRITPLRISVQLERIQRKVVPIVVSITDNPPSGYSMGTVVVTPTQVIAVGRQSVVEQVAEAWATVRLEGARADVQRVVRPVLRDGLGQEVRDKLGISPDNVLVGVRIFQLQAYKTVPIRAVITGTVAAGYQITNIVVEPQTVTLGGDPRVLENVTHLDTSPVDFTGIVSETTKPARFTFPADTVPDRRAEVFVKVTVEPMRGTHIIPLPVTMKNLGKGLMIAAPLTPSVQIELEGLLPDLIKLVPSNITVTIDLTGEVAGVIERTPVVSGVPRSLRIVKITPQRFGIIIEKVPEKVPEKTPQALAPPRRLEMPVVT